ncbi:DHH phosphoesterase [Auricularia subglabra TFB-10046 SS5]|nr:DHH phosphoesterase [Auricularia subglabra TFB-10046 SS5]
MRLPSRISCRTTAPCLVFGVALIVLMVNFGFVLTYRFPWKVSLKKLSSAAGPGVTASAIKATTPAASSGALLQFLRSSKERYLQALRDGTAGTQGWTVVMGNEAGDLDTLASSVAYAFLAHSDQHPFVALQQTPRGDLRLRPENIHALSLAGLGEAEHDALLCIDDLPTDTPFPPPGTRFALVDHNALGAHFKVEGAKVVGIIDHHEDERAHASDEVAPRIVQVPTGSCSSLVANHFHSASSSTTPPPELAGLLLSALLIDTDGLKAGGKAEAADHDAAAYLLPLTQAQQQQQLKPGDSELIADLTRTLNAKKFDVEPLGTRDLLRRDYKEYSYTRSASSSQVKVGLATVPLGLARLFELSAPRSASGSGDEAPAEFWSALDAWMAERELDVLGVLCSFRSPKEGKGKKKPKTKTKTGKPAGAHRRQILAVVRRPQDLAQVLFDGLEGAEALNLERLALAELLQAEKGKKASKGKGKDSDSRPNGSRMRVYEQHNADASRKAIAPLFKTIISGDQKQNETTSA